MKRTTNGKTVEEFLKHLENTERSPNTIRNYANDLKIFAKWFGETNEENFAPEQITPTDLRQYKQNLLDQKRKPKTINRKRA